MKALVSMLSLSTMLTHAEPIDAAFAQDMYQSSGISSRLEISDATGSGSSRFAREAADNFRNVTFDPNQHVLIVTWFGGAMSDFVGSVEHDAFEISLYTDFPGNPGSQLSTYQTDSFTTVSVDPLFSDIPNIAFYQYQAVLTGGVALAGNTNYWLSIMEQDRSGGGPSSSDAWYWMGAEQTFSPDEMIRFINAGVPGAWMNSPNGNSLYGRAFRIEIGHIPEPCSLSLLGLGSAILCFGRHRRRSSDPPEADHK